MSKEYKYKITNYGNTRSVYIDGQTWEVPKNGKMTTTDKEVADAFEKLMFVDVSRKKIEQPDVKPPATKKKKEPSKKKESDN
ncbi:hypothetical protein LCGC14_2029100 [marine sediment metagenome]|uniref:Uncharacterized protein n=1 Tax=marine sediment metagenome TaxID=412755 RepID=A0A0F9HSC3_9ZZZZ